MTEEDRERGLRWPSEPALWKARGWIERKTIQDCARAVFVTPGALRIYRERYPEVGDACFRMIENGYDEDAFRAAEQLAESSRSRAAGGPLVMLHSGVLYASPDRDPSAFFAALRQLRDEGAIAQGSLKVVLRATGHDGVYAPQIKQMRLDDMVYLEPPVGYRQALAEMLQADALLLFQGRDSNPAIPAKFYEYLRARRPIFAMVHAAGDTAAAVRASGAGPVVPLDSPAAIAAGLRRFLQSLHNGTAAVVPNAEVQRYSRERRSCELAQLLNEIVGEGRESVALANGETALPADQNQLASALHSRSRGTPNSARLLAPVSSTEIGG